MFEYAFHFKAHSSGFGISAHEHERQCESTHVVDGGTIEDTVLEGIKFILSYLNYIIGGVYSWMCVRKLSGDPEEVKICLLF